MKALEKYLDDLESGYDEDYDLMNNNFFWIKWIMNYILFQGFGFISFGLHQPEVVIPVFSG